MRFPCAFKDTTERQENLMIPTLFHKRKYLKESIENTCKSLSRHCNFDARNLKKRTNMMEKVTQMIAMLIKAWKKESVSSSDTPLFDYLR